MALPCFAHIPSTSFLYVLPTGFASGNGTDIKINVCFMITIFGKLLTSRSLVTGSVRTLQAKTSSCIYSAFLPNLFDFLRFDIECTVKVYSCFHMYAETIGQLALGAEGVAIFGENSQLRDHGKVVYYHRPILTAGIVQCKIDSYVKFIRKVFQKHLKCC